MAKNLMIPQTYAELERWSHMAASTEWVPKEYRGKPDSVLICVQYGLEIGLGLVQSLQSIAVINGKPSVYGDGLLALVYASPVCEYVNETPIFDEGTVNIFGFICAAKRKGNNEKVAKFDMNDAKRAHLNTKQGPWQEYPQRMLQWRARGFALRDAFPDVLKGIISREEAMDYPTGEIIEGERFAPPTITIEQQEQLAMLTAGYSHDEMVELMKWMKVASFAEVPISDFTRYCNNIIARNKRLAEGNGGEN